MQASSSDVLPFVGRHRLKAVSHVQLTPAYSLAPLIQSRIVVYSGESFVQRTPPPCATLFAPVTPSDSELEVGFTRMRLFSGSSASTTFATVPQVALKSVCEAWQCTQACPSFPRFSRIGWT